MTTQTQVQSAGAGAKTAKRIISGEAVTGCAVLGCLVAGLVGIFRALTSDGVGAAGCLLASVAAFGTVCMIYMRKG